ncbi:hypothetical protein HXA31_17310 [Salipaludibacillus agaradhaerens]|uniref:Uncharacterized protein n=1 Tax=Salipaludibacillus agaradhaerens TaxID=76935 RepID=A0A9Q4B512_SALAG|nr:hypothetical protein [Salipaludibacillus agaradhaerens]MCR6098270.1 hypothetical protein [Salipaludibacillus agaradhaerens]MCR6108941.1 hypothetical protein [Bacillus sp. A301a_S52]MCR6116100.1 hypothetical protein [Salipaludibacillus agaradhaerens]
MYRRFTVLLLILSSIFFMIGGFLRHDFEHATAIGFTGGFILFIGAGYFIYKQIKSQ